MAKWLLAVFNRCNESNPAQGSWKSYQKLGGLFPHDLASDGNDD